MNRNGQNEWTMSIDNIQQYGKADYADGDIVIFDSDSSMPEWLTKDSVIRIDMIMFMYCDRGKAQVRVRSKLVDVH